MNRPPDPDADADADADRGPGSDADRGPAADGDADAVFTAERPRLVGLAYRLLGSVADAEDVVQEAWFRWARADRAQIERPAAWLTTVVSRIGIDRLRVVRRERVDYVGPWLPEPIVEPIGSWSTDTSVGRLARDPAESAELADSLTTAFLVLLERLSPEERLAILLVDVFGESFRTAAAALDRTEESARQLAVRARRKLRVDAGQDGPLRRPSPTSSDLAVATAFVGAVLNGDMALVQSLLAPDAVLVSDGGANRHAARRPVVGADRVARFMVNITKKVVAASLELSPAWVNGRPGVVMGFGGIAFGVAAVEVDGDQVARAWLVLNPDKLQHLARAVQVR